MTSAKDVPDARNGSIPAEYLSAQVSSSFALSTSPTGPIHSSSWKKSGSSLSRMAAQSTKHLKPFATEDIKVLLLENVNETGQKVLKDQGYQVTVLKSSLPEDELIEKIRWCNAMKSVN